MRIEWSDAARVSAHRFMRDDQDGLRAVGHAVLALAMKGGPKPGRARPAVPGPARSTT
jgi:hypothetical protein